nr:ephexin-1-like isoform X2 [Petromyzon marinus]
MADLKATSGQEKPDKDDHVAPPLPLRMPIGKQMVHPHPTPTPVPTDTPSGAQEPTADVPLKLNPLALKGQKTADVIPTSRQENLDRGNDVAPPIPARRKSNMEKQVDDANPTNGAQTPVPTDTPSDGGEEPGKEVEEIAEPNAKPPDPMRALKPGQSPQKKAPLPKQPSTERPPPPPLPPPRRLQPIYANSEPMYHVYQEISHMRALNRLRHVSDSGESAFSPDDYESLYGTASVQGLATVKQMVSLWSQQSKVIESGLMSSLTKRQIQHQEAMFEIVTSEASYLKSLNVFINHFMDSDSLNRILSPRDKNDLFSNIVQVKNISESLLSRLRERVEMSPLISEVCDILYEYSLNHFKPLVSYVINIPCQITTFKKFSEGKDKGLFSSKIKLLEEAPVCEKLPFLSFLSVPYQRITRYQLLVKNVISKAEESVESGNVVELALSKLEELVQQSDKGVGERTQAEQVVNIANNIYFEKGMKSLAIVSQSRSLLKSGKLLVQEKAKTIIPMAVARFTQGKTYVMLLLFNDFLIVATKQKGGRLLVLDYADRAFVMAAEAEGNSDAFLLTLMDNHQGKQAEWLLAASNTTEKLRWVEAISSNGANENEKVYQPWDCPVVQCVRDYVALEMDELNLREEDVLCVIRKTPDGWMEGERLRSGDRGWFPASHVEEIASHHVDARNLREHKLSLMKSKMQGSTPQPNLYSSS